jgi:ketosteroid isomerase-like protein
MGRLEAEIEIPVAEQAWMGAWQRRDMEGCALLLADEFHLVSARSGELFGKEKWLTLSGVALACRSFHFDEIRVHTYGDIAIAHCLYRQRGSAWGRDWSGLFRITDVWLWRDNRWQVVTRHSTQLKGQSDRTPTESDRAPAESDSTPVESLRGELTEGP